MTRRLPLVAFLVLAALSAAGVLDHDLWTPDEPRVAAVGLSAAEGHWVAPRLGEEPFLEQPPLGYWCIGAFYRVFGHRPEHLARLVNTAFGLGTAGLTFLLARFLLRRGERGPERATGVAALAVLALATSGEFFATSRRVIVDGALVFFTTGAVYAYARAGRAETGAGRWLASAAGALAASLAFLSKGPIGLVFPGLFCIALFVRERGARRLWLPVLATGIVAFAAVAGPWLWLLHGELGASAFETLILENTIDRAVSTTRGHVRPFWMYVWAFPAHFLPATLPLAGAIWHRFRRASVERLSASERGAFDLLLLWVVLGLVVLSIASTKRGVYLVPLFPGAAILASFWLDDLVRDDPARHDRWMRAFPWIPAGALAVVAVAPPIATIWLPDASLALAFVTSAVAATFAALVVRELRGQRIRRALGLWLAGAIVTLHVAAFAIVVPLDRLKSLASVSRDIAAAVPAEEPIYLYQPDETTEAMLQLYTDRLGVPIRSPEEWRSAVASRPAAWVVTVDKTRRKSQRRYEVVRPWQDELLIEDLRPHSRAIRLVRTSRRTGAPGE